MKKHDIKPVGYDYTYLNAEGLEITKEEYEAIKQEDTKRHIAVFEEKREEALNALSQATGVDIEVLRLI